MEIKLSKTSKMPCHSWSTEAISTCNRGCKLAEIEGSVCHGCYATSHLYRWPAVVKRRVDNLEQYKSNTSKWVTAISNKIRRTKSPYFRWFDSGDLISTEQLMHIAIVCTLTSDKTHWLPTREYGIVKDYLSKGFKFPANLNIRISADMVNEDLTSLLKITEDMPVTLSAVETDPIEREGFLLCRATVLGTGSCGECRACWHSPDIIVYKKH